MPRRGLDDAPPKDRLRSTIWFMAKPPTHTTAYGIPGGQVTKRAIVPGAEHN